MSVEAAFVQEGIRVPYAAGSAVSRGEIIVLPSGRVGVACAGIDANDTGTMMVEGIFDIASASGTTFSVADEVWWDASASLAIAASSAAPEDFYLGRALTAKVSGETTVRTLLNVPRFTPTQGSFVIQSDVFEFDTETDTEVRTLVPAEWNKTGFLLLAAYGLVSEVFGGGSQDQGIVTIKDTAGSPNTLCTLTPSDGGADAVGDVIVGTAKVLGGTTGDAVKTVAAGLGITGTVTQAVSGVGAAGKMKVRVLVAPLF